MTLKQIARRLGVTQQRVQQIARACGHSERLRQLARGLGRHTSLVIPEPANTVASIATRQGLVWEIIFTGGHQNAPKIYAKRILIAGRRCAIRKVIGPRPNGPSVCWLQFNPSTKNRWAEFIVLPFDKDAFVVPVKLYRRTIFVFGREKQSPGRPGTIDWRRFYGAWGQLHPPPTRER